MRLRFRSEFDPTLLSWGGPDEPPTRHCSICEAMFAEGDVPLIMWRPDDWCVRLCDGCVDEWIVAE